MTFAWSVPKISQDKGSTVRKEVCRSETVAEADEQIADLRKLKRKSRYDAMHHFGVSRRATGTSDVVSIRARLGHVLNRPTIGPSAHCSRHLIVQGRYLIQ